MQTPLASASPVTSRAENSSAQDSAQSACTVPGDSVRTRRAALDTRRARRRSWPSWSCTAGTSCDGSTSPSAAAWGHRDVSTTQIYAKVVQEHLRLAAAKLARLMQLEAQPRCLTAERDACSGRRHPRTRPTSPSSSPRTRADPSSKRWEIYATTRLRQVWRPMVGGE